MREEPRALQALLSEVASEEQPAEETPVVEEAPAAVEEKVDAAPQKEVKAEEVKEEVPAETPAEEPEAKN